MPQSRLLLITADDFGIGPEVSRGILDLAERGALTSTVLLVNSPFAADAVQAWERRGRPIELGWHPVLTLDRPLSDPATVPSLVGPDGRFQSLGSLLKRRLLRRLNPVEIVGEFRLQLRRFVELTGQAPVNVNAHHHVHIFEPVRAALATVLAEAGIRPYVRAVSESMRTLGCVPGARLKRTILNRFGRKAAKSQTQSGFGRADAVLGITDPPFVHDHEFFPRWLRQARGRFLELTCHPGHPDDTLVGRDGTWQDGQLHRRVQEWKLLESPAFRAAIERHGFTPVTADGRPLRSALLRAA